MMKKCSRCGSEKVDKIADSPVRGAWKLFACKTCNYVWRSTETLEMLGEGVKLSKEDMKKILVLPSIPKDLIRKEKNKGR